MTTAIADPALSAQLAAAAQADSSTIAPGYRARYIVDKHVNADHTHKRYTIRDRVADVRVGRMSSKRRHPMLAAAADMEIAAMVQTMTDPGLDYAARVDQAARLYIDGARADVNPRTRDGGPACACPAHTPESR